RLWLDVKRLFAGQTMADYTLTMAALINTKYGGGDEDVLEHLKAMKRHRRNLILMGRDLDDTVFACFLRLSMPQDWNYVFAGLTDPYMSREVKTRIKGEHGNRTAQSAQATAFRAAQNVPRKGKGRANHLHCSNCHKEGHTTENCWSPGGGAEGQAPWQKRKKG